MPFLRLLVLLTSLWATLACTTSAARAQAPSRPARPLPNPLPLLPAPTPIPGASGLPGVGADPTVNAVVTGNPAAPTPVLDEKPDASLDFVNQPIADVIPVYERFSGKHVIMDQTVQGQITVKVRDITRTQAAHIIEKVLTLNGFSLVPAEDNIVQIIGLGKPVRPVGVPIYLDVKDVPDNEQIATLLVRLSYLEPQETQGLLSQYIPPGAVIAFTAFQKAGALLITDSGRSVRRLFALIQQIDVSPLSVEDRFFRLQRADVAKAVEFLNSVFETKGGGATPGATGNAAIPGTANTVRRPIRRVGEDGIPNDPAAAAALQGGIGGVGTNGDTLIVGRITMTPDIRTNRIHVVTNHRNMVVVERLLTDFDAETAFAQPVRFPLKFLRPDLILPILVQSLQEGGEEKGNATPGATNPNKNGQANANNNNGNSFGGLGNGSLGGLGGGSGGGLGSLGLGSLGGSTQEIDTTPQEAVVGNTRLIADVANSSIILLGGRDAQEKVAAIIAQLDRRSPQVMIHTVIGELSLGKDRELGFQYLLRNRNLRLSNNANLFTSSTAGAAAATPAASPNDGTTSTSGTNAFNALSGLASGLGTSFSGVGGVIAVGRSLNVILAALDSTTRFKTISRPMIVTSNFKKATITSGQTITVSTGSIGSLATTNTSTGIYNQTTQELAALSLSVTPQINSDKEVVMEVDQQLNSPLGGTGSINGLQNQNLSVRQLHNYVSARNGETIVLGGLITQDDNISDSGIPYLSHIPVIGGLFKSHTRDATRSELIILMQPEVVDTAGVMADLREREEGKTYLGHDLDRQVDPIQVKKAIPVTQATTVRTKRTTVETVVPLPK